MPNDYLIYGAYGYTGELIARLAVQKGHRPVLAGRDEAKLRPLAEELGLPYVALDLQEKDRLQVLLTGVSLVLNCAGPFSLTAQPLVEACLQLGRHYLDITGEIEVFEWIADQDEMAKKAGVVLLPGTGFDVVPTDCLAVWLKNQLPDAQSLELAFYGAAQTSRGTALTVVEGLSKGGMIRRKGVLTAVPMPYLTKIIEFLLGQPRTATSIPWGDVSTAWYSTGIPDIVVYLALERRQLRAMKLMRYLHWLLRMKWVQRFLKSLVKKRIPSGPDVKHRTTARSYLWGEVRNGAGESVTGRLETSEGYHLTATTALLSVEKVLQGGISPGFNTPAKAFGPDFILLVEGTKREKVGQ